MKKLLGTLLFYFGLAVFATLLAQDAVPEIGEAPEAFKQLSLILGPFLASFVVQYPAVTKVLLLIGGLRSVLKPLVSFVWAVLNQTPSSGDNEKVRKVVESKYFGVFAYLLDYFASLKLKNPEAEK